MSFNCRLGRTLASITLTWLKLEATYIFSGISEFTVSFFYSRSFWNLCDDLLPLHEMALVPEFLPDGHHAWFDHGSVCDQNKSSMEIFGHRTPCKS